jgi:hypothetical protein
MTLKPGIGTPMNSEHKLNAVQTGVLPISFILSTQVSVHQWLQCTCSMQLRQACFRYHSYFRRKYRYTSGFNAHAERISGMPGIQGESRVFTVACEQCFYPAFQTMPAPKFRAQCQLPHLKTPQAQVLHPPTGCVSCNALEASGGETSADLASTAHRPADTRQRYARLLSSSDLRRAPTGLDRSTLLACDESTDIVYLVDTIPKRELNGFSLPAELWR